MKAAVVYPAFLALVLLGLGSGLNGQDSESKRAMLKTAEVPFRSLVEDGTIKEEGRFNDASKTYEAIEVRDLYVKLADGGQSGWVLRSNVDIVGHASPKPDPKNAIPFEIERWAKAKLKKTDEAIRLSPSDGKAFADRGVAKHALKDYEGAIRDFDESIRLDPKNSDRYLRRANTKRIMGDYASAEKDYGEAQRLRAERAPPFLSAAIRNAGIAKSKRKDFRGAIASFDEALRLNPNDAIALRERGDAKNSLSDYRGAIQDCDEAIRLNPNDANAYRNRAEAKRSQKDYEGSIQDCDAAIRLNPNDAYAYSNRGMAKRRQSDYEGAIQDYDAAIRLNPKYSTAYNNRAFAKVALKDYDGALQDYDAAIRLNPRSVTQLNNKSFLLSTATDASFRDAEQAVLLAEQALAKDPKSGHARNARSCAYALAGDFENAIAWQKKAMEDELWLKDEHMDGGVHALDRIAKWEAKELWLQPE